MSKTRYFYSDSDTSSCRGQDASNSKSPSPASLRVFNNALPNLDNLHFGFYLLKDDKRQSCIWPCVRGLTPWRNSFHIEMEREDCCKTSFFSQVVFSNIVQLRVMSITAALCIIFKNEY